MHLLSFLFLIAVARADLGCLKWDLLFQPFGLFCWFSHENVNAVEKATFNAITTFAEDVKNAAVFQVEHHPLVLAYEWADTAIGNGTSAANEQVEGQIKDEIKVDIGFGKGVVNTVVNLYELTHWYDVAFCLMAGAREVANSTPGIFENGAAKSTATASIANNATSATSYDGPFLIGSRPVRLPESNEPLNAATSRMKRSGTSDLSAAESLAKDCVNDKFKQIAKPAVFNITDPEEKIGSTLAQIAAFFVPIGLEESGAKIAVNGFDLAIPGAEDAGRIYLKVENGAEHFATEAEAMAVKDNLEDTSWVKGNCDICQAPGGAVARKVKRNQLHAEIQERLLRRGAALSMCCRLPTEIPTIETDFEVPDPNGPAQEITQEPVPYHNPRNYRMIPESALSPPPVLRTWGDAAANKEEILQDLAKDNTAVLAWSPDTTKVIESKELFGMLRKAFKPVDDDDKAFAEALRIGNFNGKNRLFADSQAYMLDGTTQNPSLQKLQAFTKAAIKQAKDTVTTLKELTPAQTAELGGSMDIYWIPASERAIRNPDPRGLHVDANVLQFGAADQPGLVVQNKPSLFRVPIVDNGWHLIKCTDWNLSKFAPNDAMAHTVFGPDIVKHGRVSVIVNVFRGFDF